MSVNSFIDYPMEWTPSKADLCYPYYASLADRLERDIANGALRSGAKLPPQRELADYLDLSLSTVTKAYKLCENKGLVSGRTGSGTYVCAEAKHSVLENKASACCIQMGTIFPLYEHNVRIAQLAAGLLQTADSTELFSYGSEHQQKRYIAAGQKWLSYFGIQAEANGIFITAGAQNALSITLSALFKHGDTIAVDRFTYANFIGLANMLGIRLLPIDGDAQGMLPASFDGACKTNSVQGVYLMPSCSNPTGCVMGTARREHIAAVITKNRLLLIEDDIYAFLLAEQYAPVCTLVPERSVYINSLSKSVCAGLRVSFMYAATPLRAALERGVFNCVLKCSPLNLDISSEIIQKDLHIELMADKRRIMLLRNQCFARYFPAASQIPASYFQWLTLPSNLHGRDMEIQAAAKGVCVLGGERFAVGETGEIHTVRLATCSPENISELARALSTLRSIIDTYSSAVAPSDLQLV